SAAFRPKRPNPPRDRPPSGFATPRTESPADGENPPDGQSGKEKCIEGCQIEDSRGVPRPTFRTDAWPSPSRRPRLLPPACRCADNSTAASDRIPPGGYLPW